MRILEFKISDQTIQKVGDFSKIVAGTKGYLIAKFEFDEQWEGFKKAASFWRYGKEYPVLIAGNACEIPAEALTSKSFEVSVTGLKDGKTIKTGKVEVRQEVV